MNKLTELGVIGKSGMWYPCGFTEHLETQFDNSHDAPFVSCRNGFAEFEAYFMEDQIRPTRAQFETLMDWLTFIDEKFEDMIVRDEPWKGFLP
jgi:hypothetical protein